MTQILAQTQVDQLPTTKPSEAWDQAIIHELCIRFKAYHAPGTILLFGGARYSTNNPLLVRLERYVLTDGSGKPPKPGHEPVLTVEYVTLADETLTASPLVWQELPKLKTWHDFNQYHTWLPFSGDLASLQARALAILDGKPDPEVTRQLLVLQEEEAEQASTTALMGGRNKAYFEAELQRSERLQQEAAVLKRLMDVEIDRRLSELNNLKAGAALLIHSLQKKIEGLQRTITVIELYLGVEEELHQLRSGTPAPATAPITFRQAAMYMDEEVAVRIGFKEARQFDFQTIERFDEWLLEPGNLDYVMPEQRCIAIFHPRRRSKDYGGGTYDSRNEHNRNQTYFLIRDGENLHRIYTSKLIVSERLFPKRTELHQMFEEFNAAHSERQKESLEDKMYVYRKLSTFLQGLLDRTTVFGRLSMRINLFNLTEQTSQLIHFVCDADDTLLTDGRVRFWDWVQQINSRVVEGSRVLLTGDYGSHNYRRSDMKDRLFYYCDDHRVPPLPEMDIYTVESVLMPANEFRKKEAYHQLCILYLPVDTVYGSWGDYDPHTRKKRVNWKIYPEHDRFVLHYDPIALADVYYYMHDRVNRKDYSEMLPVLESIIHLKTEEKAGEAPFIRLLLDEAHRQKIIATAEQIERALVWWKTKNKWKRALTVDDAKAFRMILKHLKA